MTYEQNQTTYLERKVLPRRQVAYDGIKCLRDLSRHVAGDRFAFDDCRLQRTADGAPSVVIDAAAMEPLEKRHPDSYGEFLSRKVIPMAESMAETIEAMPSAADRFTAIDAHIREASTDTLTAWALSAASMRRLIFPASYRAFRRKRSDDIIYLWRQNDYHRGRPMDLPSLTPSGTLRFIEFLPKMMITPYDLPTFTPLQNPATESPDQ